MKQLTCLVAGAALLAGCAGTPSVAPPPSVPTPSSKYYSDDGPPTSPRENLDAVPDAAPRLEPLHRFANRPYTVLGRNYVPATTLRPYRERGIASWYGRKFHGKKTSTGEIYDMYAMTAAHPTLPLPSYARVTNGANGRSVVVRVNDRGPFLHGRVIDLSFAAATRIGIADKGSGEVEVEAILPGEQRATAGPLPPVASGAITPVEPQAIVAAGPIPPQGTGGFVVQLGAFANFSNAQAFLAHVQNQIAVAQVEPRVRQADGLWRVFVGPYADRDEAARIAERIDSAFGLAATVMAH